MSKYFILFKDYNKNEIRIIKECYKKEAYQLCEEIALNYISGLLGNKDDIKIYKSNEHNRPFNYFIESDINEIGKYRIKLKYINKGWLYNSVEFKNIVAFYVINGFEKYKPNVNYDLFKYNTIRLYNSNGVEKNECSPEYEALLKNVEKYNDCLQELSENFDYDENKNKI